MPSVLDTNLACLCPLHTLFIKRIALVSPQELMWGQQHGGEGGVESCLGELQTFITTSHSLCVEKEPIGQRAQTGFCMSEKKRHEVAPLCNKHNFLWLQPSTREHPPP